MIGLSVKEVPVQCQEMYKHFFFVPGKQAVIGVGYLGCSGAGVINIVEKRGLFLYNGENLVINKRKVLKK